MAADAANHAFSSARQENAVWSQVALLSFDTARPAVLSTRAELNQSFRFDEEPTLETSAFRISLYAGQFTLSTQLIKSTELNSACRDTVWSVALLPCLTSNLILEFSLVWQYHEVWNRPKILESN